MKKLEVIAFNLACCADIERTGAHRIELCANPHEGGTTPSPGFIKAARKKISIELFPIIRPRGGDFNYTADEFEIIKDDVLFCKSVGCDGVVIGILHTDGRIDKKRSAQLVSLAYPMEVTFHRAFDRTSDPYQALEDIVDIGCKRILTSGLQPMALGGSSLIKELIEQAAHRIIIMPGSGIRSSNIKEIAALTSAVEFHSSARKISESSMVYSNANLSDERGYSIVDAEEVGRMLSELNAV